MSNLSSAAATAAAASSRGVEGRKKRIASLKDRDELRPSTSLATGTCGHEFVARQQKRKRERMRVHVCVCML